MNIFLNNVRLAKDLAFRELESKYKRSLVGWGWLLLTPLCLLGIYSLIFGQVFGIEWDIPESSQNERVGFVLPFFVGLAAYLVISDVVNSSSVLFVSKRTFVIKSPFPIWVLWVSNLMRASIHAGVTFGLVLIVAIIQNRLSLEGFLWLIISLIICLIFICALSLLLSSIGPFIGDISEVMRLILRVLFYASPITYPLDMLPDPYQAWMWFNPLACIVELLRNPIVFGHMPPLSVTVGFALLSILLFTISWWIFQRVKGVISDVV